MTEPSVESLSSAPLQEIHEQPIKQQKNETHLHRDRCTYAYSWLLLIVSCTAVLVLLGFGLCYFFSSFRVSELTSFFLVASLADCNCLLYACWLILYADSYYLLYTVWMVSWADFHCWSYHLCSVLCIFHCYVCYTVIKWHVSMQCPLPAYCELSHLPNCKIRILSWFFCVKNDGRLVILHQVQYDLCRYFHENWRVWVLWWWCGGGGDTILVQVCVLYCVMSICC